MGRRRDAGFCSAVLMLPSGGLVTEIIFIGADGNEAAVVVVVVVFFTTVQVLLVPPIFVAATLDIEPPPLADTDGEALFVSVMISTIPPSLVVSYVTI